MVEAETRRQSNDLRYSSYSLFFCASVCANDMPDVTPSDTCQTLDYFQSPTVFVDRDDTRVGTANFLPKDDSIKEYIQTTK